MITKARIYWNADPYGLGDDELGGWWLMIWLDGDPREPIELTDIPVTAHGDDLTDYLTACLDCYGADADAGDVEWDTTGEGGATWALAKLDRRINATQQEQTE